jgi:hypothetical protein
LQPPTEKKRNLCQPSAFNVDGGEVTRFTHDGPVTQFLYRLGFEFRFITDRKNRSNPEKFAFSLSNRFLCSTSGEEEEEKFYEPPKAHTTIRLRSTFFYQIYNKRKKHIILKLMLQWSRNWFSACRFVYQKLSFLSIVSATTKYPQIETQKKIITKTVFRQACDRILSTLRSNFRKRRRDINCANQFNLECCHVFRSNSREIANSMVYSAKKGSAGEFPAVR